MKTEECTKKKYEHKQVLGYLNSLKRVGYKKQPWRNEVSYYKCDICKKYHTSSKLGTDSKSLIKDKTYFEHQKENWKYFLLNYSNKKARI